MNVKAREKGKKGVNRYCFPKCYRLHFVRSCNNSVPVFGTTAQSGTPICMLITMLFLIWLPHFIRATITNIIIDCYCIACYYH